MASNETFGSNAKKILVNFTMAAALFATGDLALGDPLKFSAMANKSPAATRAMEKRADVVDYLHEQFNESRADRARKHHAKFAL